LHTFKYEADEDKTIKLGKEEKKGLKWSGISSLKEPLSSTNFLIEPTISNHFLSFKIK
jgi:hypothetical protein